jgi:hypothetical protein
VVIRHKSDKEGRNKDLISGPFCKVWYCVLFFSLTFGLLPPALEYYTYTAATGGADRAMPMRRLRLGGHCLEQKAHGARNPGRRRLGWLPSRTSSPLSVFVVQREKARNARGRAKRGKMMMPIAVDVERRLRRWRVGGSGSGARFRWKFGVDFFCCRMMCVSAWPCRTCG